jgi:flagellar motor protein MotB
MAKKKCQKCPPPAPSWLATFADLSTLLLTFFVLLISMATFNPVKFAQVLGYFQTPTGMGYNIPTPIDPKSAEEFFVQIVRASTIRQDTPEGGHQPTLAGEQVKVTAHKDNYVVKFTDRPFFERFEVRLTPEGKRRLDELAKHLKDSINVIHVIGRTSTDEDESAFRRVLEQLPLRNGSTTSVLATPEEEFERQSGRVIVRKQDTALIQSRDELGSRRAETVAAYLKASGIDHGRIKTVSVDERAETAEDKFNEDGGAFVFTWGGSDSGRTVEVVVTGEVVARQ